MPTAAQQRVNLIKVIHVAKRELAMEDDAYRAMLANIPELEGVTSTAKLAVPKLQLVLEALKQKGFKVRPKGKSKGKPHNFDAQMPEEITKIEALLADMGLPWSYADAIANQMFGIQRCAWVRDRKQLKAIIASLYVEQEKRGLSHQVNKLLAKLPKAQRAEVLEGLPENWDRRRALMKRLIQELLTKVDQNGGNDGF